MPTALSNYTRKMNGISKQMLHKSHTCPLVLLNDYLLSQKDMVQYLDIYFDRHLTCKGLRQKRLQVGLTCRKIYWFLGCLSQLSLINKEHVCEYLYGHVEYNSGDLPVTQILWKLSISNPSFSEQATDAPWFVSNVVLHRRPLDTSS